MSREKTHVIIIGGGAAGMLAAIAAGRQGASVTLLERNPRVGKKLLTTGNGRCNFTNIHAGVEYYQGKDPGFAGAALTAFSAADAIAFFEEAGIAHKVEEGGKVFPLSDQAASVLDVLRYELSESGIEPVCEVYVQAIRRQKRGFAVEAADGTIFQADRVILAAGGKAMPSTGSDGNGFMLAQKLGHTIVEVFPGLVQLKLDGSCFKQIDGVKFVGTAEILHKGKSLGKDCGDILFGNYGVSGPPVLQLSRQAAQLLQAQQQVQIKLVLLDRFSRDELSQLMAARFAQRPNKTIEFSLVGLVNKRLIPVLLKAAGIGDSKRPVAELAAAERESLVSLLQDWRFTITGTKSWPCAQVTAGGVAVGEINPDTMESKLVKGLYFAGEIIDIDGQCGGFNLQWAWSSGFLAGQHAARSSDKNQQ